MENKLPEHIAEKIFQQSEDLYNKLDELAREYDHYDFGLPMFDKQKQPIIDLLTERYQQCQQMAEALEKIANPIAWLQKQAKAEGSRLDGIRAYQLSESAAFLKGIAAEALATWNEGQEPNKNTTNEHTNKP